MDFIKQYTIQAIMTAANNLRLSSEKIEVVALIREHILTCKNVQTEIQKWKKVTEFSKFAIKLGEIYNYISNGNIDFLKITDHFKTQSHNLVRELSHLLDIVTPLSYREIMLRTENLNNQDELQDEQTFLYESRNEIPETVKGKDEPEETSAETERNELKEHFILDDLKTNINFIFENFVESVLKPIEDLDDFIIRLGSNNYSEGELNKFADILRTNANLSKRVELEILTNMHLTLLNALNVIKNKLLTVDEITIEAMRSCLIVIVAVVREKDVDISYYLDKAEKFGKFLKNIKD